MAIHVSVNTGAKTIIKAGGGITLDGDVTATKTLTVIGKSSLNGGVDAKGGSGTSMNIIGKMTITETINNVQIESHEHPYNWTDGGGSGNTSPPIVVSISSYYLDF